jgi:hypothetical protein
MAFVAMAIGLGAFGLYTATLAPTLLWGDDAELQRLAYTGGTPAGGRSYPLWLAVAHLFTYVPFGDLAWRANLVSAVFAAIAVAGLFVAARLLTGSIAAAALSALALALSHTFWLHAVRAEVYTLYLALFSAVIALLLHWRRRHAAPSLVAAFLVAGLAPLAHPLAVTALPGLAYFVWWTTKSNRRRLAAALTAYAGGAVTALLWSGALATGAAALPGVAGLGPRDLVLWIGFLAYQYLLALPLGVFGFVHLWRQDRVTGVFLSLLFAGNVCFALLFRVPDQFVFYLPSYLVFALWIAVGASAWWHGRRRWLAPTATAVLLVTPILAYRTLPVALNTLGVNPLSVRDLPNRDANTFFLFPPKTGYRGAREFGQAVLRDLPPDAAVLADWLPLQTLRYLQDVEGLRRDVLLREIYVGRSEQAPWLLEQSRSRPVFLAATDRYYDLAEIESHFRIVPFGMIYHLEPRARQ